MMGGALFLARLEIKEWQAFYAMNGHYNSLQARSKIRENENIYFEVENCSWYFMIPPLARIPISLGAHICAQN